MDYQKQIKVQKTLYFGFFVLFISLMSSSCRIGNHVEQAPPPPPPLTGYYLTHPESLALYMTTDASLSEENAPVELVPAELAQTFSNPIIFKLQDATTGDALIASKDGKAPLPISIDSQKNLSLRGKTTPRTFWLDPACSTYLKITESGKLIQDTSLPAPADFLYSVSGRIELKVQVTHFFEGDCASTFQTLANCYIDANQCGGDTAQDNSALQAVLVETFGPYIQSGLITESEISKMMGYSYEVMYR